MAVAAPPHDSDSTAVVEQDRFEALIEEARQRARRRRQAYGAVAVVIAAVVAVTVAINSSDVTHSEPSGLDTPAGAAATAPTGELVASMHLWQAVPGHRDVWLYLYADGRLITLTGSGAWLERRLTPEAVAGVQDEIISTGLFDADRRPSGSQRPAGNDIQVRNGDRLVNLPLGDGQEDWTPEFVRLAGRLATLQSWLPATAWAQSETTSYVPQRYAVCAPNTQTDSLERAELLSHLPTAAAAVLETANLPPWDEMLPEIDPAGHQRRGDDGLCFDLPADQAQRVAQSLDSNVNLPSRGHGYLEFDTPGSVTIGLLFYAILPHGAPECACYG